MSQYNLPEAFNRAAIHAGGVTLCGFTLIQNAGNLTFQSLLVGAIGSFCAYNGFLQFAKGLQAPQKKAESGAEPQAAAAPEVSPPTLP